MKAITNGPSIQPDEMHAGVVEVDGSRYEYCVWRVGGQWYAAFPDYHAASKIGSGTHHASYVQEKMRVSTPDARAMCGIINACIMEGGL